MGGAPAKATLLQLVFMIYTAICGGAYGLEPMVSASGPGVALLTLIALPIVWATPMALACAELSSTHPVEGGYYRWSRQAFGDLVGYLSGFLTWIALFATNALYVVLFVGYLERWLPDLGPATRFLIGALLVWTCVLLNWLGIRLVGTSSVVMMGFVLVPFVFLTALGLLQWRFNPFEPFAVPGRTLSFAFGNGLLVAFWLYSGYEKLSVLAEEVEEPRRAFPRALAIAVPLSAASYVLPTLAGLAANGDWSEWNDFHFTAAAHQMGGPWLSALIAFGGLVSNAGLLLVTMTGQSRLPMVLAHDGLFPRAFSRTSARYGTPTVSLLLGGAILTLLALFPFANLISLYGTVQALAYLLIYAALFKLRRDRDGASGAFRVPLGSTTLAALMIPGALLLVAVVGLGLHREMWQAGEFLPGPAALQLGVLLLGPATYALWKRRSANGVLPLQTTR
ncbi:MAG TPA: APC family permease [Vicinamibacteria bacterium]|nr:APC family permease [Vicinamibacteria bacterium]